MLRRDDDSVLRVALDLEVSGKRKRGRPKKQVEEETEDWFEKGGRPETECKRLQKKCSKSGHLC